MGTGIIYAAIVVAWAAYLLPLVRHHREQPSATRSGSTTGAMRVLGRRSTGGRARTQDPSDPSGPVLDDPAEATIAYRVEVSRPRYNAAARRRRVLFLILATAIVIGVFAFVGMVPWWSIAVPGSLLVGFVVLARLSIRPARVSRRRVRSHPGHGSQPADTTAAPAAASPAAPATSVASASTSVQSTADLAPVIDPASDPAAAWVAHSPVDAWDPLPITLPTYVTKDVAPARRVRTIDLSGATAFSAGRLPEADLLTRQPESVEELSAEKRSSDDGGSAQAATG